MRLLSGAGIFLAIAAPWYAMMFAFDGVDDENLNFCPADHPRQLQPPRRGRAHHHAGRRLHLLHRAGRLRHLPLGGARCPGRWRWSCRIPAALRKDRTRSARHRWPSVWMLVSFVLMAFSATKFHHYVFPMLPPLAMLIGAVHRQALGGGRRRARGVADRRRRLFVLVGKDLAEQPQELHRPVRLQLRPPVPARAGAPTRSRSSAPGRCGWAICSRWCCSAIGGYLVAEAFRDEAAHVLARAVALLLALLGGMALLGV